MRSIGAVVAPIFQFSGFTGGDCIFDGGEAAEVNQLMVVPDVGYPLGVLLFPANACVSRCVAAWLARVLPVLLLCDVSQVN